MMDPFDPLDQRSVQDMKRIDPKVGWIAGGVLLLMVLMLIFGGIKSSSKTIGLIEAPIPVVRVAAPQT